MDKITIITKAAGLGRPIGFCYERRADAFDGPGTGTISERRQLLPDPEDPIRYNKSGRAYVIGDDLARGEPRSFHLDSITEVSVG